MKKNCNISNIVGLTLLVMFSIVCWSCQTETNQQLNPNPNPNVQSNVQPNENEPSPNENQLNDENLYGVWKLVKVTITGDRPDGFLTIDYSEYNIVYEFKRNDILTVSGVPENNQHYLVHEAGDYPYSIGEFHDGRNLQIGANDYDVWWARIFSDEYHNEILEFDTAPVDGPIFSFIKIE